MRALAAECPRLEPQGIRRLAHATGMSLNLLLALSLGWLAPNPTAGAATHSTPAPPPPAEQVGARVLRFPPDRSLGPLCVRKHGANPMEWQWGSGYVEWDYLGEARGEVTVPAGAYLSLLVETAQTGDLSPLKALRPDELQMLSLECAPGTDERAIACAAELTGLRQLALNGSVRGPSLRHVGRMRGLVALWIVSDLVTDVDLGYLTKLNNLQFLLLGVRDVENPRVGITDAGLGHVAALTALRELSFHAARVAGPGLRHLSPLRRLRNLVLSDPRGAALTFLPTLPSVTRLKLWRGEVQDPDLACLARLPNLEELELVKLDQVSDAGLVHLRPLKTVKSVSLDHAKTTVTGLKVLRELPGLESLSFRDATDEGLAVVGQMANLKHLSVFTSTGNTPLSDAAFRSVSRLKNLESLHISGRPSASGVASLRKLTKLECLELGMTPITDRDLATIAALHSLRTLHLESPNLTVSGVNQLAALPELRELYIRYLRTNETALNLTALSGLETLNLIFTDLRDRDLAGLAHLSRLELLTIFGEISDAGLAPLTGLRQLRFLELYGSRLTDEGLAFLSANFSSLEGLTVSGRFTDHGLRQMGGLHRLRRVRLLTQGTLSYAARQHLQAQLPSLRSIAVEKPIRTLRTSPVP